MFADLLATTEAARASESRGRTAFGTVVKKCASPIGANLQKRCRHCQRNTSAKNHYIVATAVQKRRPTLRALSDLDAQNTINLHLLHTEQNNPCRKSSTFAFNFAKSLKDVDDVFEPGRDTCVVLTAPKFEQNSAA